MHSRALDDFISTTKIFCNSRSFASVARLHVHLLRFHVPRNGVRDFLRSRVEEQEQRRNRKISSEMISEKLRNLENFYLFVLFYFYKKPRESSILKQTKHTKASKKFTKNVLHYWLVSKLLKKFLFQYLVNKIDLN